jgi:Lactate racemase N-terminal domain
LDIEVRRVPVLSGSRFTLVPLSDDDVTVAAPQPPEQVLDVAAAVRDALRFPLSGPTLESAATTGGRATILVDHPALPLPAGPHDPRPDALAATIDELSAAGIPDSRQTILVAGGLERRYGQRELERLLPPPRARSFRGRVLVHDVEDDALREVGDGVRINPALVRTDLVVVVSAAETVLHGGPAALVAACDAQTVRGVAAASSLVEAAGAPEWESAVRIEAAVSTSTPVLGVSLLLDLPRPTGTFRGYPSEPRAVEHVVTSPLRRLHAVLPGFVRRDLLHAKTGRLDVIAAFGGAPSVSHAEALLRGVELHGARLDEPVDALVVGVPWIGPHFPREPLNPVTTATVALGLALRLYRDAFPVRPDGTLVLVHSLTRSFAHGGQDPYAAMLNALRDARDPEELLAGERAAGRAERALASYRAGRTCHPLLPYADWAGCAPALRRLGRVVVAGSRDATAARILGFVPSHGIASALEMAHGVAGGRARVGVLLAPPYAPILVGS